MERRKKSIKKDSFDPLQTQTIYEEIKKTLNKQSREDIIGLFEKFKISIFIPEVPSSIAFISEDLIGKALGFDDIEVARKLFEIFYEDMKTHVPFSMTALALRIEGINDLVFLKHIETREKLKKFPHPSEQRFLNDIFQISQTDNPLLIVGETGTSKQFLSKAIHKLSNRTKKKFIAVNCAAIVKTLIESELFGYVKGSFTGAYTDTKGLLEVANEGTVFLDEIGKTPDYFQATILKTIEEQEIRRVGSTEPIKINVRFIAAAQPNDLRKIICDLKNRLGFPDFIEMPTLKERFRIIPNGYFFVIDDALKEAEKQSGIKDILIHQECYPIFLNHEYKGNYRELINIIRAAIRSAKADNRKKIMPKDLEEVMEKSKKFDESEKPLAQEEDLENIQLKDIISYADGKKASIIETKIRQALSAGKNLKAELLSEGLSDKDYINFRKKVVLSMGKKIKELEI